MNFIKVGEEDWVNLDLISRIWIESIEDNYFLVGEFIHNGEDQVISIDFPTKEKCIQHLDKFLEKKISENYHRRTSSS